MTEEDGERVGPEGGVSSRRERSAVLVLTQFREDED